MVYIYEYNTVDRMCVKEGAKGSLHADLVKPTYTLALMIPSSALRR